jgi:hypothetical protein
MYVFGVGMERCGTHSIANIIKSASKVKSYVVHEDKPLLCREAKLVYGTGDFRTESLKEKLRFLRKKHKECKLVCEANHRLGYFITTLMKEFAPYCKFIFSVRDPVATIISRISIWAHYPDFIDKYPEFYKKCISSLKTSPEFNQYRISPPRSFTDKRLAELYLWEWLENYKFVRKELACIPKHNRFIVFTEDITSKFDHILGFVGMEYFKVDDEVMGWARVKSDSVFPQSKEKETDNFITNNRDPSSDETIIFANREVGKALGAIGSMVLDEFSTLQSDMDDDLVQMDARIVKQFKLRIMA